MMDTLFLGYSAQNVDISITLVVQELHPTTTMATALWLNRGDGAYRADPKKLAILVPACALSLVLLAGAEAGSIAKGLGIGGEAGGRIGTGFALAACATVLVTFTAVLNRHCTILALEFCAATGDQDPRRTAATLFTICYAAACAVAGGASLGIASSTGEHMTGGQLLLAFAAPGMVFCFLGSITWRTALILTDRIQLHALLYLNGPTSLAFLWAAGLVAVSSPPHPLAGAAVAIGANLAANIKRPAGKARTGTGPG